MARISGVDLPNKQTEIALTAIYGVGRSTARHICERLKLNPSTKLNDLSVEEVSSLRKLIDSEYKVEGALRSEVALNIKRLRDIGCYRGLRHRLGLPVRAQRTKTNARTRKGKAKTVANKKK
ncbi:MAG: 30S ribosomal protein S13 [Spirochaetota bacterium]